MSQKDKDAAGERSAEERDGKVGNLTFLMWEFDYMLQALLLFSYAGEGITRCHVLEMHNGINEKLSLVCCV